MTAPLNSQNFFLQNGFPRTKTNGLAQSCNDMTWAKAADELVRSAEGKNLTGKLGQAICSGQMENCKLYLIIVSGKKRVKENTFLLKIDYK